MNTNKLVASVLFFALYLSVQTPAWGAVPTVTQTITLNPGWNAVYLEVQPLVNDPAAVFPVLPNGASIWAWTGKNNTVSQFIQDENEPKVVRDSWLSIFNSDPTLNNFYSITANSAYLIDIPKGTPQMTIQVTGRPTIRHKGWVPDSFNLTGFGFSSTPPTFASFFAPSRSHDKQDVYRLDSSGVWGKVDTATTVMRSGEAFWIYCQNGSDYQGPFTVETDGTDGLDFGAGITTLKLTVKNWAARENQRTITVSQLSATNPVPLEYKFLSTDNSATIISRDSLTNMPSLMINGGESTLVTLVAQRGTFSGAAASVLEFTDGQGSRVRVPVTAISNWSNSYPGLWSGAASLDKVSQLTDTGPGPDFAAGAVKTTPAPLNLKLILHQDRNGKVRLLKQAIVMYQDETRNSDGTLRTKGRYVVLTKDGLIPNYSGVTQRDGAKVGRRLSAIGFDYSPSTASPYDTDFDGTALNCSGTISTTIECRAVLESSATSTNQTNPFLHRYHPDHDNLKSDFKTFSQEVNRIERIITLNFDSTPKENPANPPLGWGVSVLGGTYRESIRGLAKGPIKVEGNFIINLATDVDMLNQ